VSRAIIIQDGGACAFLLPLREATCIRSSPSASSRMATVVPAVDTTSSRIVSSAPCKRFKCCPLCWNTRLDCIVLFAESEKSYAGRRRLVFGGRNIGKCSSCSLSNEDMRNIKAFKNDRNERFTLRYSVLSRELNRSNSREEPRMGGIGDRDIPCCPLSTPLILPFITASDG
jgi:hypothetical protein